MLGCMRNLGYSEVMSAIRPATVVDAVRLALLDGFDPTTDPHWQKVALPPPGDAPAAVGA